MSDEPRLKRLRVRSWRRGTREMDLLLGRFADARLAGFSEAELADYEALLQESDPDLYAWLTGRAAPPGRLAPLVRSVAAHAAARPAQQSGLP